jgi:MFS family permease
MLRVVFAVFAIASLGEGVFQTAFWVFIDEELGGGAREAGWLFGAQAMGGLIGAVLVGSWGKRRSPLFLLGIGSLGVGLTDLVFFNYPAFIPGIWLGLILMAVDGVPGAAFGTGYVASLQVAAEDRFRGRVFGALLAMSALFMIAGALIAGFATPRLGAVTVLTLDSLGYIGGGLFALRALGTGIAPKVRRQAPTLP